MIGELVWLNLNISSSLPYFSHGTPLLLLISLPTKSSAISNHLQLLIFLVFIFVPPLIHTNHNHFVTPPRSLIQGPPTIWSATLLFSPLLQHLFLFLSNNQMRIKSLSLMLVLFSSHNPFYSQIFYAFHLSISTFFLQRNLLPCCLEFCHRLLSYLGPFNLDNLW